MGEMHSQGWWRRGGGEVEREEVEREPGEQGALLISSRILRRASGSPLQVFAPPTRARVSAVLHIRVTCLPQRPNSEPVAIASLVPTSYRLPRKTCGWPNFIARPDPSKPRNNVRTTFDPHCYSMFLHRRSKNTLTTLVVTRSI